MSKQIGPAPPARATAPEARRAVEPEPPASNQEAAARLGVAAGREEDAEAPPTAPARQTFRCALGGTSFSVTCGEALESVTLAGFGGSFGHLQIESLVAAVRAGEDGPVGTVRGRATVAGSVDCAVHGRFEGRQLALSVAWQGEHALWPGLHLSMLHLDVREAVTGGAVGQLAMEGLAGPVRLEWADGRLVGRTVLAAAIPWLGEVVFDVSVDGFELQATADPAAIGGLDLPRANTRITGGAIRIEDGRVVARVEAAFADPSGALAGAVVVDVQGLQQVCLRGVLQLSVPGLALPVSVPLDARLGGPLRVEAPEAELSLAGGAVRGRVAASWSPEAGLVLEPRGLVGVLPGADRVEVQFHELAYDAERGLTGVASLPLSAVGIPWTEAPGVQGVDGELAVALRDNALVAGVGLATVRFDWGAVAVQAAGFEEGGIAASLTATVTDLGPSVQLDAPLVLHGEHRDGVTTVHASGVAFAVDLGAADMVLSGTLSEGAIDESGLTGGAELRLVGGLGGLATASARVEQGRLSDADFQFPEPVFRYPAAAPVVEGDLRGGLSFAQGRFSGSLAGEGVVAGLDQEEGGGRVRLQAQAREDGGLDATLEGAGIATPLLVFDRFFVQVVGDTITSDLQLSARDDLPVDLVGGVVAGWGPEGLTASGGFSIAPREGANPSLQGHLGIAYDPSQGLTASGAADVVVDRELDARAGASFEYSDGRLLVKAEASALAIANDPIVDFQAVFGGAKAGWIHKALDRELTLPVLGIPYLHGVVAEFGMKAGQVSFGGKLSGLHLGARLEPWDLLADEAPAIQVAGGFDRSDLAVGLGLGLHMKLLATAYGISVGVQGNASLQSELAAVDPTVDAKLEWGSSEGLAGAVHVGVPMQTRFTPSALFKVIAGISKFTLGVPGTKTTWKGEPFGVEVLDPLDFTFPIGALKDPSASPTADLDHLGDGKIDAIKMAVMDNNPTLGKAIRYAILATDVLGEVVGEVGAWAAGKQAYWQAKADGKSDDEAFVDRHRVQSMFEQNIVYQQEIKRHHSNLSALLGGGIERVDVGRYASELDGMLVDLVGITTNLDTLSAMDMEVEAEAVADYHAARRAIQARMELLARG